MALFAGPAGTWPNPTLIGQVLPSRIRNRVRYRFFFKKKPEAGLGFIKKIWNLTRNPARIKTRYPEITKIPHIYIYTYNLTLIPHLFSSNLELTPPSLSPHPHSDTPFPSAQSLISAHVVSQSLRHSLTFTPTIPQSRLPCLLTLTLTLP